MTYDATRGRNAYVAVSLASFLIPSLVGCGGNKLGHGASPDASTDAPLVGAHDSGADGPVDVSNPDASADASPVDAYDSDSDGPAEEDSGPAFDHNDCFFTSLLQVPGGGGLTYYGGGMTLGQSGSILTANFGGAGDIGVIPTASLRFSPTSGTSATLLPAQDASNIVLPCPGRGGTPTVAQLASGSLTYNAGTVFLSIEGTAEPVATGCSNPGGPAATFVTCSDDAWELPRVGVDAGSSDGGSGSGFVGFYSCHDSEQIHRAPPGGLESGGGGAGTLTITAAGGVLTAAYADDTFVQGSLQFVTTTDGTAAPAISNETMEVFCVESRAPGLDKMVVTASTLKIDGSWIVLSFVGSMSPGSGCAGGTTSVSILCAR
jgi:hypothetical protein